MINKHEKNIKKEYQVWVKDGHTSDWVLNEFNNECECASFLARGCFSNSLYKITKSTNLSDL